MIVCFPFVEVCENVFSAEYELLLWQGKCCGKPKWNKHCEGLLSADCKHLDTMGKFPILGSYGQLEWISRLELVFEKRRAFESFSGKHRAAPKGELT